MTNAQFKPVIPIPDGTPSPPTSHTHRGEPSKRYPYYFDDGAFAGWVCEFSDSHGQPVFLPLSWCQNSQPPHELMWRWQAFMDPRPLYGLMDLGGGLLDSGFAVPVIVFPTERDADIAREALSCVALDGVTIHIPCLSWPGGPLCALKADWSPLRNRPVWVWPGYSAMRKRLTKLEEESGESPESKPFLQPLRQPGWVAAAKVADVLTQNGCETQIMTLPEPGVYRAGWGVSDVIGTDGLTGQLLFDFIRTRMNAFYPSKTGTDKPGKAADLPVEGLSTPQQACAMPDKNNPQSENAGANPAGAGRVETGEDWSWLAQLKGGRDSPLDCRENIQRFLQHHPELRGIVWADEFARTIVMRKPAPWVSHDGFQERVWEQLDSFELGDWLSQRANLLCRSMDPINQSLAWNAGKHRYIPPKDYCDSLQWDKVERLDTWLNQYLGAELNDYTKLIGKLWFIGMVARAYKPGCTNRFMIIFQGKQYIGKSTALRIIGGKWFRDTVLDHRNKDQYLNWQGCWVYEIGELDSFNRAESTTMKAIISSPSDYFRAPYEAKPMDYPRTVIFAGTTNQNEFFKDSTGNTRFWPIQTGTIDLDGLVAIRDQLFAEATELYRQGGSWWPTMEQQRDLLYPEQSEREIIDPWEQIVEEYVITKNLTTIKDILIDCLKIDAGKIDASRSMAMRVGSILQRLGWKRLRSMRGGKREYHYQSPINTGNYDAF